MYAHTKVFIIGIKLNSGSVTKDKIILHGRFRHNLELLKFWMFQVSFCDQRICAAYLNCCFRESNQQLHQKMLCFVLVSEALFFNFFIVVFCLFKFITLVQASKRLTCNTKETLYTLYLAWWLKYCLNTCIWLQYINDYTCMSLKECNNPCLILSHRPYITGFFPREGWASIHVLLFT